ncbi:VOC family protein [Lapillicoccus jejuensis]|uniref:Catechol 2,3-dioxygenase-like lactoylglutathione lyase family enzyme n=1 Tax=Lapillicoccus jejuensis TaxID=402171 RepID=A0A542E1H0_9MICO|nr:VOC family protein [Lapillicoccus jejuensis]TQJ09054.1 catechol 2,3-dioxygenase-like lactoylglutathione lyase family enzyme [Lapillicoccus jejuensis]
MLAERPRGSRFVAVRAADTDRVSSASLVADVAHAGLTVPDLDDALSMWCDGLGFTLERTFTLDDAVTWGTTGVRGATIRAATVTLGPHRVELLQYDPLAYGHEPTSPGQAGVVHIALTVRDLDAVIDVCGRPGWRPVGAPHLMTSGPRSGTRIIYLDGTGGGHLELLAPPTAAGAGSSSSTPTTRGCSPSIGATASSPRAPTPFGCT